MVWRWSRYIRRERVRVINVHYPDLDALSWLLVCRVTNARIVLSFHGADVRDAASGGSLARVLWRFLLRHADSVLACSESLARALGELGSPLDRVRIVRNGVTPEVIERHATRPAPVQLPNRYVAALATFESKKGLDVLLRAFDRVAAADASLHLVLAGRLQDPIVFQELLAMRERLAAAPRVEFLPNLQHDTAIAVLARAVILVLPSRVEPFGLVVLEAGVLRRPVIATAACGVVGYLRPDAELVVVPSEDDKALAIAMERLLADPESACSMAERLRRRVLDEFTWRRIAKEYAPAFGLAALKTDRATSSQLG
jgi:glycogen(starch) synthase